MSTTTVPPASYYQRDWVLACAGRPSRYSTPLAWDLRGPLDRTALGTALRDLVARHDALRTAFVVEGSEVHQVVARQVDAGWQDVDLSTVDEPLAALDDRIVAEAERPRALDTAPLWHLLLVRLNEQHHVLAAFIHHLVFDGWSHGVLHDELVRCYRAATTGRAPRLPHLPLQIGDYAYWERSRRHPETEQWWRDSLRRLPPLGPLPQVGGRFISASLPALPRHTADRLRAVADREGVGMNTVLLTAVVATRRHFVGDDVVVGATRAGRDRPELQRIVGPLLDHVPVRVDCSRTRTTAALLASVHQAYQSATARALPLGLIRTVVPEDLAGRGGRLFDTRYNYLPAASSKEASIEAANGTLRIAPRGIDPALLAPPHTEDHPEVLPLSYILRRTPDGIVSGEVCGHDGIYPPQALRRTGEELAATLESIAFGRPGDPLPPAPGAP